VKNKIKRQQPGALLLWSRQPRVATENKRPGKSRQTKVGRRETKNLGKPVVLVWIENRSMTKLDIAIRLFSLSLSVYID
jgi:hypothetical protein